uniref:Uncharacterized protein n=1 Tax=Helianthus annuus TaxID=4232 RepID=A0A251RSJ6_HELAN
MKLEARNPGRRVDTPEVIPAEKVRFEGTNKSLSDDDQAPCQEPNTQTEASA